MICILPTVDWSKGGTCLFKSTYMYPMVARSSIDNRWNIQHQYNEANYISSGDYIGAWYPDKSTHPTVTHPDAREVGEVILGYIYAYRAFKTENPSASDLYKQRAIGGLDYLVREQIKDGSVYNGSFKYYYEAQWGGTGVGYEQAMEPGRAGIALVEGLKEFKTPSYLQACTLLAQYFMSPGFLSYDGTANKRAFSICFLAELYNVTGNISYFNAAVTETLKLIGYGWTYYGYRTYNHEKIMYYHQILIGNFLEIFKYMPPTHPYYSTISNIILRGLNHIIILQDSNGAVELYGDPSTDGATLTTLPNFSDFVLRPLFHTQNLLGSAFISNMTNGLQSYDLTLTALRKEVDPANFGYMTWYVRTQSLQCYNCYCIGGTCIPKLVVYGGIGLGLISLVMLKR